MSKFASVHTHRKTKISFKHNYRLEKEHPNVYKELTKNNENNISLEETQKMINDLYNQAYENYKNYCINTHGIATRSKKPKGIQNFTKKENAVKEFIFEIKENTTMQECQTLANSIADLLKIKPLQISIHRDEGHTDKDGNFKIHYHAHASFFTLDGAYGFQMARSGKDYKDEEKSKNKKGDLKRKAPIKPTFTDENMSKIQDLASEILGMVRGNKSKKMYIEDYREYKQVKATKEKLEKEQEELNYSKKIVEHQKEINQKTINTLGDKLAKLQKIENIDETLAQKTKELEALKNIDIDYKKFLELEQENKEKARINETAYESKFERRILETTSPIKENTILGNMKVYSQDLKSEYTLKGTTTKLEVIETIESITPNHLENLNSRADIKPKIKTVKKKKDKDLSM